MKKIRQDFFFLDIILQFKLRFKLFMKDKITCIVFLFCVLCFFLLISSLNLQAETKASIPIGIINLDKSEEEPTKTSQELIQRLKEVPSIYIYEESFEKLEELFLDGYITSIFAIESGYEEQILQGKIKQVVTIYQKKDDPIMMAVVDIVAGEMMYQICLARGTAIYAKVPEGLNGKHTLKEYQNYAKQLKESNEFSFAFDVSYINIQNQTIDKKEISNSLLYRQMIAGIAVILYSFMILFALTQTVFEKEKGLTVRKHLSLLSKTAEMIGNIAAVFVLLSAVGFIFSVCICYYTTGFGKMLKIFGISMGYILLMSFLFLLLGKVFPHVTSYQMVGAVFVLVNGILGFCSMAEGVLLPDIPMVQYTPNAWFIQLFTEIIR